MAPSQRRAPPGEGHGSPMPRRARICEVKPQIRVGHYQPPISLRFRFSSAPPPACRWSPPPLCTSPSIPRAATADEFHPAQDRERGDHRPILPRLRSRGRRRRPPPPRPGSRGRRRRSLHGRPDRRGARRRRAFYLAPKPGVGAAAPFHPEVKTPVGAAGRPDALLDRRSAAASTIHGAPVADVSDPRPLPGAPSRFRARRRRSPAPSCAGTCARSTRAASYSVHKPATSRSSAHKFLSMVIFLLCAPERQTYLPPPCPFSR